jgi:AP-3 complex subunit beta
VEALLNDKSTIVLGPTIAVMNEVFPNRLDLLHKHFKKLCSLMGQADEWSQIQMIQTLVRYTRQYFTHAPTFEQLDPDLQNLTQSFKPLLHSRNPLVVLLISVYFYELNFADLKELACHSLLRCLTRPKQEQCTILSVIKEMIILDKSHWVEHASQFCVYKNEMSAISSLKLEILELLACEENAEMVFEEYRACVSSSNTQLAIETIRVWRRLAARVPSICSKTIQILISLLSHKDAILVGEVVISIRKLIQDSNIESISQDALIAYLISIYETITVPLAQASIIWLVRHHQPFRYSADCLRISLKGVEHQDPMVKRQIILLASQLRISTSETDPHYEFVRKAYTYAIKVFRYDSVSDVRDQARLMDGLVDKVPNGVGSLLTVQRTHQDPDVLKRKKRVDLASVYRMGTLSQLLNHKIPGYEEVPPWAEQVTGSHERNQTVFILDIGYRDMEPRSSLHEYHQNRETCGKGKETSSESR